MRQREQAADPEIGLIQWRGQRCRSGDLGLDASLGGYHRNSRGEGLEGWHAEAFQRRRKEESSGSPEEGGEFFVGGTVDEFYARACLCEGGCQGAGQFVPRKTRACEDQGREQGIAQLSLPVDVYEEGEVLAWFGATQMEEVATRDPGRGTRSLEGAGVHGWWNDVKSMRTAGIARGEFVSHGPARDDEASSAPDGALEGLMDGKATQAPCVTPEIAEVVECETDRKGELGQGEAGHVEHVDPELLERGGKVTLLVHNS